MLHGLGSCIVFLADASPLAWADATVVGAWLCFGMPFLVLGFVWRGGPGQVMALALGPAPLIIGGYPLLLENRDAVTLAMSLAGLLAMSLALATGVQLRADLVRFRASARRMDAPA